MLYLHTEEFTLPVFYPVGKTLYIKLIFSTHPMKYEMNWNPGIRKDLDVMVALLKQIPLNERTYDPGTKIWTTTRERFDTYFQTCTTLGLGNNFQWMLLNTKAHASLEDFVQHKQVQPRYPKSNWNKPSWDVNEHDNFVPPKPLNPNEFFYNKATEGAFSSNTKTLTLEELCSKLEVLCAISGLSFKVEPKKAYRSAALKLHPDRNSGDGSKMSELNMYWAEYQKIK